LSCLCCRSSLFLLSRLSCPTVWFPPLFPLTFISLMAKFLNLPSLLHLYYTLLTNCTIASQQAVF
jgi:hypothetical protein